jgi:hypothetical protein
MAITFLAQGTTMLARVELIRTHGPDVLSFVILGCHFKRISKSSKTGGRHGRENGRISFFVAIILAYIIR